MEPPRDHVPLIKLYAEKKWWLFLIRVISLSFSDLYLSVSDSVTSFKILVAVFFCCCFFLFSLLLIWPSSLYFWRASASIPFQVLYLFIFFETHSINNFLFLAYF